MKRLVMQALVHVGVPAVLAACSTGLSTAIGHTPLPTTAGMYLSAAMHAMAAAATQALTSAGVEPPWLPVPSQPQQPTSVVEIVLAAARECLELGTLPLPLPVAGGDPLLTAISELRSERQPSPFQSVLLAALVERVLLDVTGLLHGGAAVEDVVGDKGPRVSVLLRRFGSPVAPLLLLTSMRTPDLRRQVHK